MPNRADQILSKKTSPTGRFLIALNFLPLQLPLTLYFRGFPAC